MKNIILPHEHLAIDLSKLKQDDDANLNNFAEIIIELKELRQKGVTTIIEVTNIGMGRNVLMLEQIAQATGIKILCSTGFYYQKFYPDFIASKSITQLSKIMEDEILVGIEKTNIKAALIGEIGTSLNQITVQEKKVFQAACQVANKLHVPIVTHLSLGTMALEQIKIFQFENVDLSKIVLSHIELCKDLNIILKALESGVNVGIDTIGKIAYLSDENRIVIIKKIIQKGYIKQLLLSSDVSRKSYLKTHGGLGWIYLIDEFYKMMLKSGITKAEISQIMEKNPQRIFGV